MLGRLLASAPRAGTRCMSAATRASVRVLSEPLAKADPELAHIIADEKDRQRDQLVLIASENYTSRAGEGVGVGACAVSRY